MVVQLETFFTKLKKEGLINFRGKFDIVEMNYMKLG